MAEMVIPQAVIDRVNAELVRSILEAPDYVEKIVKELLNEAKESNSYSYNDPEKGKSLFERVLRRELRNMVETSMTKYLRETYAVPVDEAVKAVVKEQEKLDGTLSNAFARIISEDYKVNISVDFKIMKND